MMPGVWALLLPAFAFAQIFIGAGIPDSSALLELKSTEKGFLLPRITDIQRDSIALPATGLMIFNVSKKCVEINYGRPEPPYWSCLAFEPEEELRCGAYIAPEVWQEFMCYNLGSAYTGQDVARLFSPSWEINGGYWQWGRKTMAAPGPTGPGQQQANSGEIAGWRKETERNKHLRISSFQLLHYRTSLFIFTQTGTVKPPHLGVFRNYCPLKSIVPVLSGGAQSGSPAMKQAEQRQ